MEAVCRGQGRGGRHGRGVGPVCVHRRRGRVGPCRCRTGGRGQCARVSSSSQGVVAVVVVVVVAEVVVAVDTVAVVVVAGLRW